MNIMSRFESCSGTSHYAMTTPFGWEGEKMNSGVVNVAVGDLYESDGRNRDVWVVDSIINVPKSGTMVRLSMVDGIAKITVSATNLGTMPGFKRVNEAVLKSAS
jgi:hypothetical protein